MSFDYNVQTIATGAGEMSEGSRVFYDTNLITQAQANLVHDQFGQKRPIPKNGGDIIEFRKLAPLSKAMKPLEEGVTPSGNSLNWSKIRAQLAQYGDYVTISDMLDLTSIDRNLVEASTILGNQAGETLDAVTREELVSGRNVQYADGALARHLLTGGNEDGNDYLTVDAVKKAVRTLKRNKAKKFQGSYIGIVHPDVVYDLTNDPKWENVKSYADPADWYNGEIGRIHGVRFVETTEAKVFHADDLSEANRNLEYSSHSSNTIILNSALTESDALSLKSRLVLIDGNVYTVSDAVSGSAGTANITVEEELPSAITEKAPIYPGEAGAMGRDVYATLILGADAYGITELEDGGINHIIKQLGSGGTADPLNQRATVGWKAIKVAKILVDEFIVRVETVSSYEE